jgi:large subunit ribosomal protein L27
MKGWNNNMELRFVLDLQLFASHKGVGSTKNGRDSAGRRLGSKLGDGEVCKAGAIIYRQRGTKIYPGINTAKGGDDTIFATKAGVVKFERVGKDKKRVSVYELAK